MALFPHIDLPAIPTDIEMQLEEGELLKAMHDMSERSSYFYMMAHRAICLITDEHIDSPRLVRGVNAGVAVFETLGQFAAPMRTYTEGYESLIVLEGAQSFAASMMKSERYFEGLSVAKDHMVSDAPNLAEVVAEIAGYHLDHDKVAIDFALQGAAAIRGMQIHVDRRLEAVA